MREREVQTTRLLSVQEFRYDSFHSLYYIGIYVAYDVLCREEFYRSASGKLKLPEDPIEYECEELPLGDEVPSDSMHWAIEKSTFVSLEEFEEGSENKESYQLSDDCISDVKAFPLSSYKGEEEDIVHANVVNECHFTSLNNAQLPTPEAPLQCQVLDPLLQHEAPAALLQQEAPEALQQAQDALLKHEAPDALPQHEAPAAPLQYEAPDALIKHEVPAALPQHEAPETLIKHEAPAAESSTQQNAFDDSPVHAIERDGNAVTEENEMSEEEVTHVISSHNPHSL